MPGPTHFDALADIYHQGRPPYPQQLWTSLRTSGLLRAGTRVVELGAGTGHATAPMLAAGAKVTAVEPGPALAGLLRQRCPDASIIVGSAEDSPLPEAAFELAVAATAVHWFDLDVVLPKLHAALVPGGHLAIWRTAYGDPLAPVTPFRQRVAAVVAKRPPQPAKPGRGELSTGEWAQALSLSVHFRPTLVEEFRWSTTLAADQVRQLFTSFSNWTPTEADLVAQAALDLGGRVLEYYVTPLIVLERI